MFSLFKRVVGVLKPSYDGKRDGWVKKRRISDWDRVNISVFAEVMSTMCRTWSCEVGDTIHVIREMPFLVDSESQNMKN